MMRTVNEQLLQGLSVCCTLQESLDRASRMDLQSVQGLLASYTQSLRRQIQQHDAVQRTLQQLLDQQVWLSVCFYFVARLNKLFSYTLLLLYQLLKKVVF